MNILFFISAYLICFAFQLIFLYKEKKEQFVQTLYYKGLASLVFVTLAALSFFFTPKSLFTIFIFIGLCLDALADVVFNLRFAFKKIEKLSFLSGTFFFFLGHIFYLIGLIPQVEKLWLFFIIAFVFSALTQIYIWIVLKHVSTDYKIYGAIYIFTVAAMTAMGIGNYIQNPNTIGFLLFAIGAVFFLLSDLLLCFNTFRPKKIYPLRVISFVSYYIGQLLIATSLFYL
ncbi:MAG: lysoplasmalogenase [Treponema sp.]|nr:lysoplasmalogenase [Treponema sp.]